MSNPGKTNAPERQDATHQEKKNGFEGSKITGDTNLADTSNGESSGTMTRAWSAKTGSDTDRDSGETRRSDGDGKSRGDGQKVGSNNITNRYMNPNARTDMHERYQQLRGCNSP